MIPASYRAKCSWTFALFSLVSWCQGAEGPTVPPDVEAALSRAGDHRAELAKVLDGAAGPRRRGAEFLIANMPEQDLKELKADYLLENIDLAYRALDEVPWGEGMPEEVFLNEVLPYASINERRDAFRKDFHERFIALAKGCAGPAEAAALLNGKIFGEFKVKYSTERPKADQSPYETIEAGKASCTGLSVLLIDACRSVGVPARFVGTIWTDRSGNHSWVEVWDHGWHFTGAAEPTGKDLDQAWFTGKAAKAERGHPFFAIFAASFRRTPLSFPLPWDPSIDYVPAVDVTDRYTALKKELPPGSGLLSVEVRGSKGGKRVTASVHLFEEGGAKPIFSGSSKDENFDLNDHLIAELPLGKPLRLEVESADRVFEKAVTLAGRESLEVVSLREDGRPLAVEIPKDPAEERLLASPEGRRLREELGTWFRAEPAARSSIQFEPDLDALLLKEPAAVRRLALRAYREGRAKDDLRADFESNRVTFEKYVSPYVLRPVGRMPAGGWPLFIAMHGGGGAPKYVNDSQWVHMQHYYKDQPQVEGYLYLALRAPNDSWNGFYDWYSLRLAENLIRQMVLLASVDPDRVYLMGYSHGGYGAFHVGMNLPDRFAAIHASASAPTEGNRPAKNLLSTPFTYMIGEEDTMYERLKRCKALDEFVQDMRGGRTDIYPVTMELKAGLGHPGLPDRDKIAELYPKVRNPLPRQVAWAVGGTVKRLFWLGVPEAKGGEVEAELGPPGSNEIHIKAWGLTELEVFLDERMVDLSKPVAITVNGKPHTEKVQPSLRVLCETLWERGEPQNAFPARVDMKLPKTLRF